MVVEARGLIDITEMTAKDRQRAMLSMPINDLRQTLEDLMHDNRQSEIGARLDAVTIYTFRTTT